MSNALGRDLAKLVAAVDAAASECGHGAYGQRFHIMPPAGWLNDPNGLCQAGGVFHAYFQYAPFDVEGGVKVWGHATSCDLMTWDYVGAPLLPAEVIDGTSERYREAFQIITGSQFTSMKENA